MVKKPHEVGLSARLRTKNLYVSSDPKPDSSIRGYDIRQVYTKDFQEMH